MGVFAAFGGILLISSVWAGAIPEQLSGLDLVSGEQKKILFNPVAAHNDQPVVIVFLSSQCPCSASHESSLAQLAKEFGSKGVRFFGVHSNEDEEVGVARAHFKQSGLTFPVIQDEHAQIANQLGAFKTPHVFVVNQGQIIYQGGVDDSHIASEAKKNYLRDALVAIVAGKTPEVKSARSLGCIIKRN